MKRLPSIKTAMTPFPYAVDIDAPLAEAVALIVEHRIHHLPVTAGPELVGVVSDRDIRRLGEHNPGAGRSPQALTVRDIYTPDPYIVDLNERLDHVAMKMAEEHIGTVLVTRQDKLAGIFTVTDACRCLAEHLREHYGPIGGGDEAA